MNAYAWMVLQNALLIVAVFATYSITESWWAWLWLWLVLWLQPDERECDCGGEGEDEPRIITPSSVVNGP
jgi:hypothetical protein